METKTKNPLWTRDFTIITVGSVISMFGNSMAGFAMSLMVLGFFVGIGGVTSYTIRISSTQSYVPDETKGRFNGAFQVLSTSGALLAQLMAGVLTVYMDQRAVLLLFELLSVFAAIAFVGTNRKYVKPIYNRNM
ncbi:MFS transporter [Butyrivibrio sp. INlla16]|uniref:MFS transporter n=1 Tax=Butyrivibrio sp. INlla16 TaxID=1520807 RepID=UPI000884FDA5|nr:MFS transporter [Butyrivibrio sp. INlla16]SDB59505.1 Major Facilitator Superfamily protein [Butyrivibrio sp. INlla16]